MRQRNGLKREAFDNPDFVDTIIHSYPHRYANAAGDPTLEEVEQRLADRPKITVPTIPVHGTEDRVEPASATDDEVSQFTCLYDRRILPGVGHCLPAEAPGEMAKAIEDLLRQTQF